MIRAVAVLAAVVVGVLAIGATAFASNSKPVVTVDCGADGSFQVLGSPGNGNFTPAKIMVLRPA